MPKTAIAGMMHVRRHEANPATAGEPDARDGLERGGLTPYVVRPPIGSQVGTRFVQEANPVLKTPVRSEHG